MKWLSPLALFACALFLTGCGEEKPTSSKDKAKIEAAEKSGSAKYEKEMKKEEGKKDEAKKDEGKKEEPKKEEPKKDEGKKDGK